uniref:Uncharacterized protein n=1 Tax=Ditylenchus dipsaci TaxID=166011 RepID=A0A915D2E9_9BILA
MELSATRLLYDAEEPLRSNLMKVTFHITLAFGKEIWRVSSFIHCNRYFHITLHMQKQLVAYLGPSIIYEAIIFSKMENVVEYKFLKIGRFGKVFEERNLEENGSKDFYELFDNVSSILKNKQKENMCINYCLHYNEHNKPKKRFCSIESHAAMQKNHFFVILEDRNSAPLDFESNENGMDIRSVKLDTLFSGQALSFPHVALD